MSAFGALDFGGRFGKRPSLLTRFAIYGVCDFALPQNELVWSQLRLLRIASNVANAIHEMLFVADEAIEIIALPELSRSSDQLVDLARGESFPTADQFLQGPLWIWDKEGMDMVRHDNETDHCGSLAFEMTESFGDNWCGVGTTE